MPEVIILKGLPGSGKSTWAKEKVLKHPGLYKRVNKDDLRAMMDTGEWTPRNEKFVLVVRNRIIMDGLRMGYSIIVDDTNFNPTHVDTITRLVSDIEDVKISVKSFDCPLEECIKRDLKRPNSVGERVIRQMYNQYVKPEEKKPDAIQQDETKPHAYIFDIDGTLALMGERNPFDWRKVSKDAVNTPVKEILSLLKFAGFKIIILSGRDGICMQDTEKWLRQNGIEYDFLALRQKGDTRKDSIIKRELFDQYVAPHYYVKGVFDDRNQVVDLWRSLGLQCFQVADGNF